MPQVKKKNKKTKAYESGVEIVLCEVGKLEVGKCPFDIAICNLSYVYISIHLTYLEVGFIAITLERTYIINIH